MHTITGWRYAWRHYLGWFPVQFCMVCGKPYWGGLPRWTRTWVSDRDHRTFTPGVNTWKAWEPLWLPWWKDYCSRRCADEDLDLIKSTRT